MATYIIFAIIITYSVWTIYKALTKNATGNCSSCSNCQFSGSCDIEK